MYIFTANLIKVTYRNLPFSILEEPLFCLFFSSLHRLNLITTLIALCQLDHCNLALNKVYEYSSIININSNF